MGKFAQLADSASIDFAARQLLSDMFAAAVAAADPAKVLAAHLPPLPTGRCVVVGAGKAAASMAAAVEAAWPHVELTGAVVVPYGHGIPCKRIRILEARHPVPDVNSVIAAQTLLDCVKGLAPDDLVLALISGGGSAVMSLPAPGISLADKQVTNQLLLASGLDIRTMNAVRRRISAIKGGKLAAAAEPARIVTLAISDIPGDDPTAIASGPTAPRSGPEPDLRNIAKLLGPALPTSVAELLGKPAEPSDHSAEPIILIATPATSLQAAAEVARAHGVKPVMLGDAIEGESREAARDMATKIADTDEPAVLISGGETTVTIESGCTSGRGGRNTEFTLALAVALNGRANTWALAADTDGEDGANLGAAGAIATPNTLRRAKELGLDAADFLRRHDSGSFFKTLGDLVTIGPSRTNVNDFRAILTLPAGFGRNDSGA